MSKKYITLDDKYDTLVDSSDSYWVARYKFTNTRCSYDLVPTFVMVDDWHDTEMFTTIEGAIEKYLREMSDHLAQNIDMCNSKSFVKRVEKFKMHKMGHELLQIIEKTSKYIDDVMDSIDKLRERE